MLNFEVFLKNHTACTRAPLYLSTEQEERPHPQTGQKGRDGLLQCPKILLTCFRAKISDGGCGWRQFGMIEALRLRLRIIREAGLKFKCKVARAKRTSCAPCIYNDYII